MSVASSICREHPSRLPFVEDCEQEAAIAEWQGKSPRYAVRDYLRAIGAIQRSDSAYEFAKRARVHLLEVRSDTPDPSSGAALVGLKFDALTEREREVLYRLYWRGETGAETARSMGLTQGRVTQLHQAALKRLRLQAGVIQ